jgi:hypothetical protein
MYVLYVSIALTNKRMLLVGLPFVFFLEAMVSAKSKNK